LPLAYLHVFSYSPRAGTDAACLSGQVDAALKQRRATALRALSAAKQQAFAAAQVGRQVSAVIHRSRHRRTGLLVGRADNGLTVLAAGDDALLGRSAWIEVERAEGSLAVGRLVA
jgi:threonylcarbamoyladenosine tRNA methylthiotransferase MtaB